MEGLVLVNAPGVIFRNMQIGDIVLAPGVGNNRILLQGTSTIQGDRVILAGSIGSSSSGIIAAAAPAALDRAAAAVPAEALL